MIASSLLNEGYLQPAGDLSKNAVDGTAENPFLDNPDAFYYFVSERSYLATYSSCNGDCSVQIQGWATHMCEREAQPSTQSFQLFLT